MPAGGEKSLYIRPFMFASEVFLGVRPSKHVTFSVIASPAGPYFPGGVKPVTIWLSEEYTRAAPGGTGAAKCGGNYAASLLAQQEAIDNGCDQVAFLDAVEHKTVEELGGMNLFFVYDDGTIVDARARPARSSRASPGPRSWRSPTSWVTRPTSVRCRSTSGARVSSNGSITEVFACGTAAVITPVGTLKWRGGEVSSSSEPQVALEIRERLLDIQYGRAEDQHGWMHRLV